MHNEDFDYEDDGGEEFVSKSQRKREAQALTDLGKRIVELTPRKLDEIPLGDELRKAVDETRKIRAHGARKRQLLYLGKLLRRVDTSAIEAAFQRIEQQGLLDAARLHRVEHWRDRLLSEGDEALAELLAEHPDCDRQHLRQLVRDARRQAEADKPPRAARELFKVLREILVS